MSISLGGGRLASHLGARKQVLGGVRPSILCPMSIALFGESMCFSLGGDARCQAKADRLDCPCPPRLCGRRRRSWFSPNMRAVTNSSRAMYAEVVTFGSLHLSSRPIAPALHGCIESKIQAGWIPSLHRETLHKETAGSSSQFTDTGDHPALRGFVCRAWRMLHESILLCLHAQRCRKHILRCRSLGGR